MSKTVAESSAEKSVSPKNDYAGEKSLKELISATAKLWRKYHLTYDQARYIGKEVRYELSIKRAKTRKNVVQRLSREEEAKLINQAYRDNSQNGLLLKTLFLTGMRVAEFVSVEVEHFFFDELIILIENGKGGKSRYVPILTRAGVGIENSS